MLTYYLGKDNSFTIRTQYTASNSFTMSLTDMTTLQTTTASLSGIQYTPYESLFAFTASVSGCTTGSQYRVTLYNSGASEPIYWGSLQVFQSQSTDDKSLYNTQITQFISHETSNEYIIQK
jgi:hypothetical protein